MWTVNFQMFKLDLEKAKDQRSNGQHQESSRKTSTYSFDYTKFFDCVDHNKLWKSLQEMGIPDHITCLWEICMQVKKQQLELDMEQ